MGSLEITTNFISISHAFVPRADTDSPRPGGPSKGRRILYGKQLVRRGGSRQIAENPILIAEKRIGNLLLFRYDHMTKNNIPLDGSAYVFNQEDRKRVLASMAEAFHRLVRQQEIQKTDETVADDRGLASRSRTTFLRARKRSRFQLWLRRNLGSKNVALAIVFTGCHKEHFLNVIIQLHDEGKDGADQPVGEEARDGAAQPVAGDPARKARKREKEHAVGRFRAGRRLSRQVGDNADRLSALGPYDQDLVRHFRSGELRRHANAAVRDHGHGKIRDEDGTTSMIGGNPLDAVNRVLPAT